VHGEPYRRMLGVGPRHAVAAVRRNDEIIARPQDARLCFLLEQKAGRAGNEQHPLGPFLVVPEAGCTSLPGRDDALDAQVLVRNERVYLFRVDPLGDCGEQISALPGYDVLRTECNVSADAGQAVLLTLEPRLLMSVWSAAPLALACACTRLSAAWPARFAKF